MCIVCNARHLGFFFSVRDPSTGVSFAPTICWQDSGGGGVQPVGLETKGGQLAIFFDVYEYFPGRFTLNHKSNMPVRWLNMK